MTGMDDLPKRERLCGHDCIGRFFASGRRGTAGKIVALALPNPDGDRRMAAVAGKKLGKAVGRNRMRRLLRAAYRTQKDVLPQGWDLVFMARAGLAEAAWEDVTRWTRQAAERAVAEASSGRPPSPPRR